MGGRDWSELVGYPKNSLFGVLDDKAAVEPVRRDLAAAGVAPDQLRVLTERDARVFRKGLQRGGLLRKLDRLMGSEGIEKGLRYSEPGAFAAVVQIIVASREEAMRCREALKAHGGHFITYFGEWAWEELDP
jgi:hypothetical protein